VDENGMVKELKGEKDEERKGKMKGK